MTFRIVMAAFFALAGCDPGESQSLRSLVGGNDGQDSAQFRYHARVVFSVLDNPSCSAPPGFDRRTLLQREIRQLTEFGNEIAGTAAFQQLEIARQDATYEQKADSHCWADDDIKFAKHHVQMAKEDVREHLPKLRELSRRLRGPETVALIEPRNLSEFRYLAKRMIEASRPMCSIGTGDREGDILAPAQQEVEGFRRSLSGGPFDRQFEIAEADVDYLHSITMVECIEPSSDASELLAAQVLAEVRTELAAVQKAMN